MTRRRACQELVQGKNSAVDITISFGWTAVAPSRESWRSFAVKKDNAKGDIYF